jgi:hypothetical protein
MPFEIQYVGRAMKIRPGIHPKSNAKVFGPPSFGLNGWE